MLHHKYTEILYCTCFFFQKKLGEVDKISNLVADLPLRFHPFSSKKSLRLFIFAKGEKSKLKKKFLNSFFHND